MTTDDLTVGVGVEVLIRSEDNGTPVVPDSSRDAVAGPDRPGARTFVPVLRPARQFLIEGGGGEAS